jgi:replicative DNA helicase
MQYGIKLIVVDYIQLMKGTQKGNRDQEIGSITGGLKQVAKSLGIPIIALAQLSRATEQRGNKRPQLSDLRESGNIEQDADMVIFLHRPEKYGEKEIETASGTMETEGLIDVVIAKYRNGTVGDVFLYTDESFMYLREEKEIQESLPELKDYGISPDRNFETKKEPPF